RAHHPLGRARPRRALLGLRPVVRHHGPREPQAPRHQPPAEPGKRPLSGLPVGLDDIRAAAGRIAGIARRTPLLPPPLHRDVWVRPESLQPPGSFKTRGAFSALSLLPDAARPAGVVADSSGNHAQGIAAAAARLGLHATIVMPVDAAPVKVARTAAWGVEIVRSPRAVDERIAAAREIAERTGAEYVPPFDDVRIIAGQGTLGLEVAEDLPDV